MNVHEHHAHHQMAAEPEPQGMASMGGHNGSGSDYCPMMMAFHFRICEPIVLFHFWAIHQFSTLILSLVIVFITGVVYEAVKWFRFKILTSFVDKRTEAGRPRLPYLSSVHAASTILYAVQVTLAYCLMLIFMTYNVWLAIAVVLGATVGHFLFAGFMTNPEGQLSDHCG